MSNIYRYKSNGKFYSFNKDLLDAQDAAIFDKMSYVDKLKLITIYTQLKPKENDDTIILKTKKEDPKKDVRRAEYLKKKQAIEEAITAATNETDEKKANTMLTKAQEDLKKLNIEYADIVGITSANEVNISKAQKVVLQDVKELITNVNEGVNTLKADLSKETITELKDNIAKIINAQNDEKLNDVIDKMSQQLKDIQESTSTSQTQAIARTIEKQVNEIKSLLRLDGENSILNDFMKWLTTVFPDTSKKPILLKIDHAVKIMDKYNISTDDLRTILQYPKALEAIKGTAEENIDEVFEHFKLMTNYISTYNLLKSSVDKGRRLKLLNKEFFRYKLRNPTSALTAIHITEKKDYPGAVVEDLTSDTRGDFESVYTKFIKNWTIGKPNREEYICYHEITDAQPQKRNSWVFLTRVDWCAGGKMIVPSLQEIMNNPKAEVLNKPGAVETEGKGVFGVQTKKAARRDNEALTTHLLGIIDELKGRIKQHDEDINRLFEKLREKEMNTSVSQVDSTVDVHPITKPNFLADITKPITLKHTQDDRHIPVVREPDEVDDLVKALNKRRIDIEYSDDDSDDYVWGDGVGLKGGVLAELKRDLEKYGLVFNPSKDGKSYYLTVFNRKKVDRSGAGVEEAKMCVDLAKSEGNELKYKNLKELYEDIY